MTAVLILIVILLAIASAMLVRRVVNLQRRLDRADARQKAAVNTSRSVHVGKIAEQVAALLPGFPYNPKDVQWVGGTIDAIVWDGQEDKPDDLDIVFLDVKTGQARINDRQRRIQDAVEAGRVRFEVFRPETGLIQDAADVPVAEVPQIETVIIPPSSELDGLAPPPPQDRRRLALDRRHHHRLGTPHRPAPSTLTSSDPPLPPRPQNTKGPVGTRPPGPPAGPLS